MTDKKRPPRPKSSRKPAPKKVDTATTDPTKGDRIAKVLARAGVASRREAERMIEAGRVKVNGAVIDSPALNVTAKDVILFDDAPLAEPEPPRMWLYYKPIGLVTTERDEKGRDTVFAALPDDMPRVVSVGRLDINSEGLLLLTNDGEVKRKLELPSTGWTRKYRVRVNGRPSEDTLAPVRKGITVDGERFQPMSVSLDRQQGANAWLTISLREGKNREIRRAMEAVGLTVNRLLRVSYGPFQLGELKPGEVEEIRQRVVRDQLGMEDAKPAPVRTRKEIPRGKHGSKPGAKPAFKGAGRPGGNPGQRPQGKGFGGKGASGKPQGRPGARKR
ncbi:rRNA pseudouridine synthase [Aliiroseovarius sp. M344]|uniref:pseudouridine synthase n=1 Tax=Aliiroseovarius sp. M344 TaxID=2867010 RepID=UPI0022012354|nr:rRNA pseudouridine synthase [Aliiroseovarius sp. M344]